MLRAPGLMASTYLYTEKCMHTVNIYKCMQVSAENISGHIPSSKYVNTFHSYIPCLRIFSTGQDSVKMLKYTFRILKIMLYLKCIYNVYVVSNKYK